MERDQVGVGAGNGGACGRNWRNQLLFCTGKRGTYLNEKVTFGRNSSISIVLRALRSVRVVFQAERRAGTEHPEWCKQGDP